MTAAKLVKAAALGSFALSASLLALEGAGVVQLASTSQTLRGQRRLQQTTFSGTSVDGMNVQNGVTHVQNGMTHVQNGMTRVQNGFDQMQDGIQGNLPESPYFNTEHLENANNARDKYDPSNLKTFLPSSFHFALVVAQVIFSVLYYCTVVNNYPFWFGPSPMSVELQNQPAPCALTNTSPTNCVLSWCCPQARASHTFDKTGTLDYWCGVVAMFFCPFCTLCWANACTDLNPKLGGEPANVLASMACTWCCSCCVIAQDAESLDAATGARTEACGVSGAPMPYGGMGPPMAGPYGGYGGGMAPGMMGMYPRY